jgi:hypothetical protein
MLGALMGGALLAGMAAAEPDTAPLADSKKALETLRTDQRNGNVAPAAGKLRDLLPTIEKPGAGPTLPVEPSGPPQRDKSVQSKERPKNWLLSGMDKLNAPKKTESGRRTRDKATADDESTDEASGSATDLLGLYSEQQKQANDVRELPAKLPTPDPLAPFLQNWLSGSPVRGQFFDETLRRPESLRPASGQSSRPGEAPAGALVDLPEFKDARSPALAGGPAKNPYLSAMEPLERADPPPPGRPAVAAVPAITPPPPPLPLERKAGPTPPADEKKYFPQLRKF